MYEFITIIIIIIINHVSEFKNELKENKSCYDLIDIKVKDWSSILSRIRELL